MLTLVEVSYWEEEDICKAIKEGKLGIPKKKADRNSEELSFRRTS